MSPEASTSIAAPAPAVHTGGRVGLLARALVRPRVHTGVRRGVLVGTLALATIVGLSLFVVLIAADRPSVLTPTSHVGYFPRWMAGPLGGLLPWLTTSSTTLKWLFSGSIVIMYGAYAIAIRQARSLPTRWVIAAILAVHVVFVLSPPLALTDLFNYINYGRMEVVHHLNPYTTIPILEPHSDPSFLLSNWHQLLSPYGPLFTLLTFAVVPLGVAGSFWALKAILVLTSLATILLVWRCALLLGREPRTAAVLAGLNPVVLVWGLGGDHNDFLMVFFIVLGFYLLLARGGVARPGAAQAPAAMLARGGVAGPRAARAPAARLEIGAGVAFVIAIAIKASAAILLPVVLVALVRTRRPLARVLLGMLLAGLAVAAASLLAFGLHVPDLSTQSSLVTSESIPNLIGLLVGLGGESIGLRDVMDAALIGVVIACCWRLWRAHERSAEVPAPARAQSASAPRGSVDRAITAAGWASVALLVTLSWVLPWYVVWVLPLAALSYSRRLRTAALVFGVYLIMVWAPVSQGLWNALDFHPAKTPLGLLHERYVKELLD